jgi:hypothetical protein
MSSKAAPVRPAGWREIRQLLKVTSSASSPLGALGFLFYGYGFGLFGQPGAGAAAGTGVLLYVARTIMSKALPAALPLRTVRVAVALADVWQYHRLRSGNTKSRRPVIRITGHVMPRWLGVAIHAIAQPAVHGGVPWLLSRSGIRHGWAEGEPGA